MAAWTSGSGLDPWIVLVAMLLVLVGTITLLLEGALALTLAITPFDPDRSLTLKLVMVMLPFMPLVCVSAVLGGMLQVHHRFGPPAAAPVVLNVLMVGVGLWHFATGAEATQGGGGVYNDGTMTITDSVIDANLATAARAVSADAREHADALEASARELGLVPLGGLFASQRAAVRRMALEQDKEVALETLGGDIEVDAEVLEALRVPLVHLLRNAVDHGLERPDERLAAGKESCGSVLVRARVDGSEVEVEVADDGRGVDVEAVRRRAQALGALGPDASDDEALRAVLLPGLSTQVKASVTSGRGVGLDAVASALIAVGGRVEVSSEHGRGTSIRLRVPGSRVVSRGAVLEAGGSAWVVPARAVGVVLDAAAAPLEPAGAGWVMRLEDERLRYLSLADAIGAPASALPRRVVVLRDGRGEVALGVDRCRGVQRVTLRRDTVLVADLELLSGAAVLEDGEVVPMLDVAALMRLDGVGAARARSSAHVGRRRVLVVDDSELMRDVAASALREMGHEVLEAVDGRDALRVIAEGRPQLVVTDLDMPVMDGFALLEALRAAPETEHLPVVVFTSSEGDASVRRAGALGADAYVVKSRLSRVELERAVLGLLSREVA